MTGGGTAGRTGRRSTGTARRRATIGLLAAVVAGTDLAAKAWATGALGDRVVGLGPLELRLGYNTGVAFSLAAGAPSWLVVAVTAAITAGVAVVAWLVGARGTAAQRAGLGLLLGGAVANLVDRAGDGRVTDYLHTGWWPTFNLADVAIVTGAGLLVLASLRRQPDDQVDEPAPASGG